MSGRGVPGGLGPSQTVIRPCQPACDSVPACICPSVCEHCRSSSSSSLLFSPVKVSPSSRPPHPPLVCDAHHLLSILPSLHSPPAVTSSIIHPSPLISAHCAPPPFIHPSISLPPPLSLSSPHHSLTSPPQLESTSCVGELIDTPFCLGSL